jgi:two-component system, LuxR family, response regulator FixJ
MKTPIHVLVVDDDEAMRDSLAWLLESHGMRVTSYCDAESFLAASHSSGATCILLDVRMPGMSGVQLHDQLLQRGTTAPVIFLTGHGDVAMAVETVKRGAFHFVEKPFTEDYLVSLIHRAIEETQTKGNGALRPDGASAKDSAVQKRLAALTPREREVLDMIVEGKPNKTIAAALDISAKTVEGHRAHIMEKLDARNAAELVHLVLRGRA